jgi:hypothetical protein
MPQHTLALSPSAIAPKVHWIRHEKVILDFDLAALYGVEARALNQAVKRNLTRFPDASCSNSHPLKRTRSFVWYHNL